MDRFAAISDDWTTTRTTTTDITDNGRNAYRRADAAVDNTDNDWIYNGNDGTTAAWPITLRENLDQHSIPVIYDLTESDLDKSDPDMDADTLASGGGTDDGRTGRTSLGLDDECAKLLTTRTQKRTISQGQKRSDLWGDQNNRQDARKRCWHNSSNDNYRLHNCHSPTYNCHNRRGTTTDRQQNSNSNT